MAPVDKIEIELAVVIGEATLSLKQLLAVGRGAFIPLGGDERKRLEIRANGRKIAEGRVALSGDQVSVRLVESARKAA